MLIGNLPNISVNLAVQVLKGIRPYNYLRGYPALKKWYWGSPLEADGQGIPDFASGIDKSY